MVRKHAEADYHLLQFRGLRELLEQLDHNLKITDGILRHRIIKLRLDPAPPQPERRCQQLVAGVATLVYRPCGYIGRPTEVPVRPPNLRCVRRPEADSPLHSADRRAIQHCPT